MASKDTFYAATPISYGERVEDGSQEGKYKKTIFKVGDKVEGLPPGEMKALWNAGALRRETEESHSDSDAEGEKGDESGKDPKPPTPPTKATSAAVKK